MERIGQQRARIFYGNSNSCQKLNIGLPIGFFLMPNFSELPLDQFPWWAPGLGGFAFGLITCLHGYKLLKVVLFLLGFLSGLYVGLLYAPLIFDEQPLAVLITAAILGVALGIFMNSFYKAGVFILGAYMGGMVFLPFLQSFNDFVALGIFLLAIVLGGFAALKLQSLALKVATAGVGAWHLVQSVFFMLKIPPPFLFPWEQTLDKYGGASLHDIFDRPWYFWTSVLGLFIAGFYTQTKKTKKSES
ncbi:MAG: hypothetical protein CMI18_09020 [Opitutaceae bacterium]|nr:hypothetical protein [Opitutaceae bacterium]